MRSCSLGLAAAMELLGALCAQAEDIQFENLSVEHGLSHPGVRAIVQDHHGFMWFGTEDGLNRYDGYSFTVHKHNPKDSNSLSSSSILCLLEDDNDVLWIGTGGGGLNSLDRRTGKFRRYTLSPGHPNNQHVSSLCKGRDGILWVGSVGLIGFERRSGRMMDFARDSSAIPSITGNVVMTIHEDTKGVLWIGTWFSGVNKIEHNRRSVSVFKHYPGMPSSLSEDHVISVHEDSQGDLWFGTNTGGLNRFDPREEKFIRYPKKKSGANGLNDNTVRAMYEDQQGRLWLGTSGGGVNILDTKTGHVTYLVHALSKPTSLSGDHVYAIYEDNAGTLWIGTDGGISKYSPAKKKFTFIPAGLEVGSFPYPVGAICESRHGELWIVNYGKGVTDLNRDRKSFRYYAHDEWYAPGRYGRFITTAYADRLGHVWFGSIGNGLIRFDRLTESFKTYKIESSDSSAAGNSAGPIYEDQRGVLWIGTGRGIARFNRAKETFTYYGNYASGPRRDPAVFNVECILEDKDGILVLGTQYAGLIEYDPRPGIVSHHEHNSNDSNSISSNHVTVLHRDKVGRLWIGTRGGGINLYDRNTPSFNHITEDDGLLSNVIHGILEDDHGNLWISTPKGLSCYTMEPKSIRNYGVADGISGLVYRSCARSRTGEMIFGNERGLFFFHPDSVQNNTHVPNIVLTAFNVLNEPYPLSQPISNTKEIILDHTQNFFSFEFAALDYTAPEKNRYAYRLEGVDDDWVQAGTGRYACRSSSWLPFIHSFRTQGQRAFLRDRELTFGKLDAVNRGGNTRVTTYLSHLLAEKDVGRDLAESYSHVCPAGVYEVVNGSLHINPFNCIDCKATDILAARWSPREGAAPSIFGCEPA